MDPFDVELRTRIVFGAGSLGRLPELARSHGFRRTLLVADPGLVASGYVDQARALLKTGGIEVVGFHAFDHDPDTAMIETGVAAARDAGIDSLVGLGGGSSMDCAKGINFVLTNGGGMADYLGYGKAVKPLLPMIGIPTTAGTGSEAQSYALISDARTHVKMPRAHRIAAPQSDRYRRLRRDLPCRGNLGHDPPQRLLRPLRPRGLASAREPLRAGARSTERRGRPRGHAARRPLRGDRHRELDARGHPRLREPADRALPDGPRGRRRPDAAARGALERRGGGRALRGAAGGRRPRGG